jgi:hypothetical protein
VVRRADPEDERRVVARPVARVVRRAVERPREAARVVRRAVERPREAVRVAVRLALLPAREAVLRARDAARAVVRRAPPLLERLVVPLRAVDRLEPPPGTAFSNCFPRLWALLRAFLM